MKINVAHLRDQGIDFAVFDADAPSRTKHDRDALLHQLTDRAKRGGLRVDKAALAFTENGQLTFYGTQDLVHYLAARPTVLRWTHALDASEKLPRARYQVVCITKRGGHYNPHERISHVGIATAQGTQHYPQEQVIAWIDNRDYSFYVSRGPQSVEVTVAVHLGRKYLKTQADGIEPNNLLALPAC